MTASEISVAACRRIDEADPANPISVTNAEVLHAINDGHLLASLLTLFLVKTVSFPLSACWHQILPVLPDYIVPLRLTVGGVRLRPSTLSSLDAWNPNWQATSGPPTRYVTAGANLLAVVPQPGVTLASLTYAASPPALVSTDTPLLPPQYHESLVNFTSYSIRKKEGAQSLARGLGNLQAYLTDMRELGLYMRTRSESAHYDTLPAELNLTEMSKQISRIIARQAKQTPEVAVK